MRSAALLSLPILLAACDSSGSPHACTDLFAFIPVVVLDSQKAVVPGLTIRDSIPRTGEWLTISQVAGYAPDQYTIFSDSYQSVISPTGDIVAVMGRTPGGASFHAVYQFDIPDGCHVHKVSGPDTVIVQ